MLCYNVDEALGRYWLGFAGKFLICNLHNRFVVDDGVGCLSFEAGSDLDQSFAELHSFHAVFIRYKQVNRLDDDIAKEPIQVTDLFAVPNQ